MCAPLIQDADAKEQQHAQGIRRCWQGAWPERAVGVHRNSKEGGLEANEGLSGPVAKQAKDPELGSAMAGEQW